MGEYEETLEVAEAYVKSANRSRYVIIVLVFMAVLDFVAYWNSRPDSWVQNRLKRGRDAIRFQAWGSAVDDTLSNRQDKIDFKHAQELCQIPRLQGDSQAIKEYVSTLNKNYVEKIILVPVPFFGITLDVNDIGILGGFGFTVILLWLRLGLSKEMGNLRLVLYRARSIGRLQHWYEFLAMQQLLTVPKPVGEMREESARILWNTVPRLLFALPVVVQSLVIYNDLETYGLGSMTSEPAALSGVILGSLFLVLILILTVQCLVLTRAGDEEWCHAAFEIENSHGEK